MCDMRERSVGMAQLPAAFLEKMKGLLGEEYDAFLATYGQPRKFGLRVNTLKITPDAFAQIAPFHLEKIPWVENGFFYEEGDCPARHPFYFAGLYYLQEPSAMTPAAVLPVRPGDRVLDLCAAPGGKATELGAKLCGQGVLVANDRSVSRAKALLKNIEVFGIRNAFVTCETPARLAERFPHFFDKILVDAPCSGEGMFRKDPSAARAWSAQKPQKCAFLQREIVHYAAQMLAPGGMLLYSTCTFSPEENEQVIAWLLAEREDLELVDIPWHAGFSHGIPQDMEEVREADEGSSGARTIHTTSDAEQRQNTCAVSDAEKKRGARAGSDGNVILGEIARGEIQTKKEFPPKRECARAETGTKERCTDIRKCVRIFPHRMAGEGHFLALLRKIGEGTQGVDTHFLLRKSGESTQGMDTHFLLRKGGEGTQGVDTHFLLRKSGENTRGSDTHVETAGSPREKEILRRFLASTSLQIEEKRLEIRKGQAYVIPESLDVKSGVHFLRNGLYLGEIKKDRFEPSQALAMAMPPNPPASINLDWHDARVTAYLRGEGIPIREGDSQTAEKPQNADANAFQKTEELQNANAFQKTEELKNVKKFQMIEAKRETETAKDGKMDIAMKDGNDKKQNAWRLVSVNGYPLGWGKQLGDTLKNKYHAGWRSR